MSGQDESSLTLPKVKNAITERLREKAVELPHELRSKIRQMAKEQGKSENDTLTEVVLKGLSSEEAPEIALILKGKLWRVCHISQIEIKQLPQQASEV